ncbi:hypothetical protein [Desulfobacula phenolica]|uniref:hypothetical protein n=1 Tax=Desulfobacula phenolica TaxID=90732 RepID=UPI000B87A6C4|nr:hypothetical protein [Desulfobacula phenolica]
MIRAPEKPIQSDICKSLQSKAIYGDSASCVACSKQASMLVSFTTFPYPSRTSKVIIVPLLHAGHCEVESGFSIVSR